MSNSQVAEGTGFSDDEKRAVGLYAVLARDPSDFLEMLHGCAPETLRVLYRILVLPNPKHDFDTNELNAFGASLVEGHALRVGVVLEKE
jgi:hypothetical protein